LKLFTGFAPGRLFQIATKRSAGQPAISSVSSFWLLKESNGVAVVAAASSWVPNAVMLFCSSIVNVFIIVLLGATLCAVMTWITPAKTDPFGAIRWFGVYSDGWIVFSELGPGNGPLSAQSLKFASSEEFVGD
jgi:hypothetical protein